MNYLQKIAAVRGVAGARGHLFAAGAPLPHPLAPLNRSNIPIYISSNDYSKSIEEKLGLRKPKRPMNAFMKFLVQIRPTLMEKNPAATNAEITSLASKHWEQVAPDVKEKLTKEFQKETEQYKKDKATFIASLTPVQKEEIQKLKDEVTEEKEKKKFKAELKMLNKPKRPMSSYLLFCQHEREKHGDLKVTDFQKQMKKEWDALAPSAKATWEEKGAKLLTTYRTALSKWEEKMARLGNTEFIRAATKSKSEKAAKK